MSDFEQQLQEYVQAVEAFRSEHDLPAEWFAVPDHVAIKCADGADYETTIKTWVPQAAQASYVHMNNRRLGTVKLQDPISVGACGQISWLEIMEPRPEKVGKDLVGVDHMEFYVDDLSAAATVLEAKGITFEPQENPGHKWLSISANGHELKLNNKALADIVAAELANGMATIIK